MPVAEPVKSLDAPLGRADAARRWALRLDDGSIVFPGLARPEAERLAATLVEGSPVEPDAMAVAVVLPVVLSDGAGPHLLSSDGSLALALGPHPHLPDLRMAMGEPRPGHRIGVVGPLEAELWRWHAAAIVAPDERVHALDALAAADDVAALAGWVSRFATSGE